MPLVQDLGVGVGFRVPHYSQICTQLPEMDWFELLAENHMVQGGAPLRWAKAVSEAYPVVLHGVSMSLGSEENPDHTKQLLRLIEQVKPRWVSDHVCFTGDAHNTHDLLPVPYVKSVLDFMVRRAATMQQQLGLRFAVENPSSYLGYTASTMPEWEFVGQLAERADIGILLDVNNIVVSAYNHGFKALDYVKGLPLERVVQIHLAGHSQRNGYRLDTHDSPVCDEVWELYRWVIKELGPISTLIEWDGNIPTFERLSEEAATARAIRNEVLHGAP